MSIDIAYYVFGQKKIIIKLSVYHKKCLYIYQRTWYFYKHIRKHGTSTSQNINFEHRHCLLKKKKYITFTVYSNKCLIRIKEHGTSTNI